MRKDGNLFLEMTKEKITIGLEPNDLEKLENEAEERRIPKSTLARYLLMGKLDEVLE
jgi:hypothetical protein